ncbi:MAG: biopolymer transporter ExbD [bacterium]
MAFKRTDDFRDFELTSLIDIVFLLLIFFLIFFAISLAGETSETNVFSDLVLPRISGDNATIQEDLIENLVIQISPDTATRPPSKVAYVLWPTFDDTVQISRGRALEIATLDSTFAQFPPGYLMLPEEEFVNTQACTLIANSLDRYIRNSSRSSKLEVEIRAEQSTEFRILGFILDRCSAYQDTIPQLSIRVQSVPNHAEGSHGL